MSKAKNPKTDEALELYRKGFKLKDIAKELNVPEGTVRRWKSTYGWDNEQSERSDNKANVRFYVREDVKEVIKNQELTEKQQLFCLYYVKLFNATKAYQKAYGCDRRTAGQNGYELLKNTEIRNEINRLKQNRFNREMLTEDDIFQKYMDIAFADITDFVDFDSDGVVPRPSHEVDGTLISEVKQGKFGIGIKLTDRMKALEWLANHMNMATEEQKLRMKQIESTIRAADQQTAEDEPITFQIMPSSVRPEGEDDAD